jgi:ABC-type sugar transport system ATPase subunit
MSHLIMRDIRSAFVRVDCLEIPQGELTMLIGPSGAGKSTLLNILAGFVPHTGKILLDNRQIHTLPPHRRRIGYLFQDLYLFPHMTVFQNLKLAMHAQGLKKGQLRERVFQFLDLFRIPDLATRYPAQISGGEKQRVAMARAIASNPDLLLLDEPLSSLDDETVRYIRTEFLNIQRQFSLTTLFVTHNLEEADELGDRIIMMKKGQLRVTEHRQYSAPEAALSMLSSPTISYL